jgi:hypothetical protein
MKRFKWPLWWLPFNWHVLFLATIRDSFISILSSVQFNSVQFSSVHKSSNKVIIIANATSIFGKSNCRVSAEEAACLRRGYQRVGKTVDQSVLVVSLVGVSATPSLSITISGVSMSTVVVAAAAAGAAGAVMIGVKLPRLVLVTERERLAPATPINVAKVTVKQGAFIKE